MRQIKKDTGVSYTESGIRAMLRSHNFTPKVPDSTHKNKVSNEEIEEWQKALEWWLSCVKRDGFEMYVMNETILLHGYSKARSMVAQRPKNIADLFWRSPEMGDLRCNIGFAPVFFVGKKIQQLDVS